MNEFKKRLQFKRFLAGFLAAVMVVTMVPASTVSAAENTGISAALSEADDGVTEPVSDTETAPEDVPIEVGEEDSTTTGGTEPEGDTEGSADSAGEDAVGSEDIGTTPAETEEGSGSEGEGNNPADTVEDGSSSTQETDPVPQIVALDDKSKVKEYTGYSIFENSLDDYVQIKVGDSILSASEAEGTWYTYAWQAAAAADGTTVTPVYAGKYTLVLTASEAAKAAGAQDGKIDGFEITPAKLTLNIEPIVVPPGSTKEEVEGIQSEDISFEIADASNSSALSGAKGRLERFISLALVKGSLKNVADNSDVSFPLKKSDGYVMDVKASFSEGTTDEEKLLIGSYTLGTDPLKVSVKTEPLKATEVVITRIDAKDGSEWYEKINDDGETEWALRLKTYDGKTAPEKLIDTYFTVKVQEAEKDPAVVIPQNGNNIVEGAWVEYVNDTWLDTEGQEHDDWKYKELDTPPADAGEYTYRVAYSSTEGIYDQSELYIDVEILPAEIAIVPKKTGSVKGYMTAEEVLRQFDYAVYDVKGGKTEKERTDIDRDHFWGTSYDDTGATQPYAPVLYLEAAPKGTQEWKKCENSDRLMSQKNDYRVVFSGYKAVYNADGSFSYEADGTPAHMVDVNESDSNYVVDKALSVYVLKSTDIQAGALVTVETDRITDGSKSIEEARDKARVYNPEASWFKQREEYKKAYLKDENGRMVSDVDGTDAAFEYTWYVAQYPLDGSIPEDSYTEGYVDLTDLDVWKANRSQNDTSAFEDCVKWTKVTDERPENLIYRAGIYKLEVAFDNAEGDYYAEENIQNVYYVIRQREIRVTLEEPAEPMKVMSETTVEDFLNRTWSERNSITKQVYNVTDLQDPKTAGEDRRLEKWEEWKDYRIEWKVVQRVPSETDPSQTVEQELEAYDTFEAGGSYFLKIADVEFLNNKDCSTYRSDARNNTAYRFSAVATSDGTGTQTIRNAEFLSADQSVEIGVDKMGETLITITADPSKLPDKTKIYDGRVFHIDGDEGSIGSVEKAFSDALVNGLIIITTADGTDVTKDFNLQTDLTYTYYTADGEIVPEYKAPYVGTYILKAEYKGDTQKYHSCDPVDIAEVEIRTRELTLDASDALDDVTAGTSAQTVNNRIVYGRLNVSGYAPSDSDAFKYGYAWYYSGNRILSVYEKEAPYTGRVTCAGNYYLEYTGQQLIYPHSENYTVKYDPKQPVNVVRGHSTVISVSDPDEVTEFQKIDSWEAAAPDTQEKNWEYTLNIMEHIPYVYRYTHAQVEEILEGNLVKVNIRVPEEYRVNRVYRIPDTAAFESQVEKAGGYVLSAEDGIIELLFDATEGKKTEFSISWEPGYTEKYILDFADANERGLLLKNLADAVAPKSLAFNSPDTKMVVGQIQQLDVKMKKVQMDDLVCLEYGLSADSPKDILSVDQETGAVTALKPGAATVEVYPIHLVKGVKTRMTEKKVSAKVKITVTDVAAPKITKVKALDTSVNVSYKAPEEGFRREIYVLKLETGKEKARDVEAMFLEKISAMSNEKWQGIFAAAPQYYDREEEQRIERNIGYITVDTLKADTPYAVYVRNVSGIRTLEDGSEVVRSEKGSVAIFRTTKMQLKSLKKSLSVVGAVYGSPTYNVCDEVYTPRIGFGKTDTKHDKDDNREGLEYFYTNDNRTESYYQARLSDRDVYIFTEGEFGEVSTGAEESDTVWHILPLTSEQLHSYEAPNLSYTVYDSNWKKTDLVSVDKNGKVTMKGVGKFFIRVKDENTCTCSGNSYTCNKCAYLCLKVTTDITSIAPKKKKIQLQVGEKVKLGDLLNYKAGSKVVKGYEDYQVVVDDGLKKQLEEKGFILSGDRTEITAIKEETLQVTLKDKGVADSEATFTLSSVLSPVKSLKTSDVIDDRLKIGFQSNAYTYGEPADGLGYRIEILDGRNNTRRSIVVDHFAVSVAYNEKTKRYNCEYQITGLTQQSQYTINVYTIFEKETSAKSAKVKAKTTKMAVADEYLVKEYGGLSIWVSEYAKELTVSPYESFTSGNVYTLTAEAMDDRNRSKMTDTLTWKSTNTKVATVKAGKGSFSASLKAVKPGYTMIEVRSKIWKNKVVARYGIQVCAVGDAYKNTNRYYEENEPSDPNDSEDPYKGEVIALPLSAGEKRKVSVDRVEKFEFKVPEAGKYSFHAYGDHVSVNGRITGNGGSWDVYGENERATQDLGWLKTGDIYTLTFNRAYVSDRKTTAYFISIEMDQNINQVTDGRLEMNDQTKDREVFSYKADTDGYYRFQAPAADGSDCQIVLYRTEAELVSGSGSVLRDNGWYSMKAGDTVYGEVRTNRNATVLSVTKNKDLQTGGTVNVSCTGGEYIAYTVDEDGYYQFYSENAATAITAQTGSVVSMRDADGKNFYLTCKLTKGETGYLKVITDSLGTPAPSIKLEKTDTELVFNKDSADNNVELSFAPGKEKEQYISFTAPENGYYHFYTTGSDKIRIEVSDLGEAGSGDTGVKLEMKAGDMIYLKVSSSAVEAVEAVLHVANITPDEIGTAGEIVIPAGDSVIRSFTASETGCYEFALNSSNAEYLELYANIQNAEAGVRSSAVSYVKGVADDTGATYSSIIRYMMDAGETVYLRVSNDDVDEKTVSLAASKTGGADQIITDASNTLAAGAEGWRYFTADRSGMYTFEVAMDNVEGGSAEASLRSAYTNNVPGGNAPLQRIDVATVPDTSVITYSLDAGESIWLYVKNKSNVEITVREGVKLDENSEFTVLHTNRPVETVTLTSVAQTKWARFTADRSGVYDFKFAPGGRYIYGALCSNYNDSAIGSDYYKYMSNDFVFSYKLDAGESVWLKVEAQGNTFNDASSVDIGLSVSLKARQTVSEGSHWTGTLMPGESEWVCFTAVRNGLYKFDFNTKGGYVDRALRKEYGSTSYISGDINSYGMKIGESVWLYVRNQSSTKVSVDLSAEFTEDVTIGQDNRTVSLTSYSDKQLCFTADRDGIYLFEVTSQNGDLYGYLKDSYNGSPVTESKSGSSFVIPCKLTEGKSVWLYISEQSGQETEVTVKVSLKDPVVLSVGENTYDLLKSLDEWSGFTAPEDGMYQFDAVSSAYRTRIGLYEEEGSTTGSSWIYNGNHYTASRYMKAGEKMWLYTNTSYDGAVTVTIEKEGEYFSYTATTDGYYRFQAPNAEGGSYPITLYSSEEDRADGSGTALKDNGWYQMQSGMTVYGFILTNGGTTEVNVTKNQEMAADADTRLTVSGGEYLSFTVQEAGFYQFSSKGAVTALTAQVGSAVSMRDADGLNFYLACELKAGETGYLKVMADQVGEATSVTMKKVDTELVMSEATENKAVLTLELEPGRDAYVSFTAPAGGYYHFYTEGAENTEIAIVDTDQSGEGASGVNLEMKAKDQIFLKVSSGSAEKVDVTLCVENMSPEKIKVDGTADAFTIPSYDSIVRTFTAAEAGCYQFVLNESGSSDMYLELYANMQNAEEGKRANSLSYVKVKDESSSDTTAENKGILRYVMKAGETVYLRVYNGSYSYERTGTLEASKAADAVQITGETSITLAANEEGWRYFTADRSGTYNFTFVKEQTENSSVQGGLRYSYTNNPYLYSGSDYSTDKGYIPSAYSNPIGTDPASISYSLGAGESVWAYVKNNRDTEVTVKLNVESGEEFAILYADGNPETVTLTSDAKTKWARFTAEKSGIYDFRYAPGGKNINGALCSSYGGSYINYEYNKTMSSDFVFSYKMEAGKSVWMKVEAQYNTFNDASSADIELSVSGKQRYAVLEGDVWSGRLMPGEAEWVQFTAEQSGIYKFSFTSDNTYYQGIVTEYGSTNSSNNYNSYGLKSGESVWLYKRNSGTTEMAVEIGAALEKDASLTLHEAREETLAASSIEWFNFKADRSGTYIFKVAAAEGSNLNGYLSQNYNDSQISSYVNKTGNNFEIPYRISSGGSVWLRVREQNGEETKVAISVSIKAPTELSIGTHDIPNIAQGIKEWSYFTVSEEGLYSFDIVPTVSATIDLVEAEGSDPSSQPSTSAENHWIKSSYYMNAGETVWLYTYTTAANPEITATITKEAVDISADSEGEARTVDARGYLWRRFTSEENGIYEFKYTANSSIQGYLCESFIPEGSTITPLKDEEGKDYSTNGSSYTNFSFYRSLKTGESVWLCAYNNNYASQDVTLSVVRKDWDTAVTAEELLAGKELSVSAVEVEMVKFKADTAGTYTFGFENTTSGSKEYLKGGLREDSQVYYSRESSITSLGNTGFTNLYSSKLTRSYELEAGQEIWLWLQNSSNYYDQTVTLSVTLPSTEQP